MLGQIYLTRSFSGYDVDKAIEETEEAVELEPNRAHFHYLYGAALGIKTQTAGMFKQALLAPKTKKAFARAVELDPNHVLARIALAQYYLMAPSIMGGDEEEGWKQIDAIIKLDEVQGRTLKANFLARSKKQDEAEKEYKILIASKPKDWRVWHRYGYFCLRFEKVDEAITSFKKYVELRPDTADSYQSLAEGYEKKKDYDAALMNLNKSLSIDKKYVPALLTLGDVYKAKGQKKEAKETYQQALSSTNNEYYKKQAEKKLKELE